MTRRLKDQAAPPREESGKQKSRTGQEERVGWLKLATALVVTVLIVMRLCVPPEGSGKGGTLWLTLAGMMSGLIAYGGWWSGRLPMPRWGKIDAWVALLCGGHVLSAFLVVTGEGDKRAALNYLFEWGGVATLWVLLRTTMLFPEGRSVLVRGLVAMLVAQGGLGIWQHHYGYGEMSSGYLEMRKELDRLEGIGHRSPDVEQSIQRLRQKMVQAGIQPHMLEGVGRKAFESRLLGSSEALGRCSLPNTLAGLLLAGWVMSSGFLISTYREQSTPGRTISLIVQMICWMVVSYAILLTKSRTGYAGLLVSSALFVWYALFRVVGTSRGRWGVLGGVTAGLVAAVVGGYLTGGIDRLVWEEAPKSLKYRMEYWKGTFGVIGEAPLLGIGSGQFRQHYLAYKLPESSEEIVDPHNLFLDVWCNGGVLGLAGLLGIIGWVIARGVRPGSRVGEETGVAASHHRFDPIWNQMAWIGGLIGFLGLYLAEGGEDRELLAIGAVWVGLMSVGKNWVGNQVGDRLPEWGVIGLIGVGIHLLGNGGIGMPTVLICLLSVLAAALPVSATEESVGAWRLRGAAGMSCVLSLACLVWGCLPVSQAAELGASANYARTAESRLELLKRSTVADPLAPDVWGALSTAATEEWLKRPLERTAYFDLALSSAREGIRRDPMNGVRHRQLASLYWYRARITKSQSDALAAIEEFERAISRSPHRVDLLSDAAEGLALADKNERSRELAERALQLDELNHRAGHSDKYLTVQQVERLSQLISRGGGSELGPGE